MATYEGLASGAGDLATDARAFAMAVKTQKVVRVRWWLALAAGVLGFFGWWSVESMKKVVSPSVDAAQAGVEETTAALTRFLMVASGGVIVALVRIAVVAAQTAVEALNNFSNRQHRSGVMLEEVRPG